ncbi:MAG: hypothetical protein U0165_02265 [Polyangiaceae bacterium]
MMFIADLDRDALLIPPPDRPTVREIPMKPQHERIGSHEGRHDLCIELCGVAPTTSTSTPSSPRR